MADIIKDLVGTSVTDPKLYFSDPDPTCQVILVITDPEPSFRSFQIRILFLHSYGSLKGTVA